MYLKIKLKKVILKTINIHKEIDGLVKDSKSPTIYVNKQITIFLEKDLIKILIPK